MNGGTERISPPADARSSIQVAHVDNPFRRRVDRFQTVDWERGLSIEDVVDRYAPAAMRAAAMARNPAASPLLQAEAPAAPIWEIVDGSPSTALIPDPRPPIRVTVSLNGHIIPKDQWYRRFLLPGDQVILCPDITGGGDGGGKSVLRMILMIGVAAAGMWAGAWLGAALGLGTFATALVQGVLVMAGGLLVNALIPASTSTPTTDTTSSSQSYSWNPENTESQGVVISRWYGTHRVYGNIIASYLDSKDDDEFMNAILSLGFGPVSRISDFRINDQAVKFFKGINIRTRRGFINQDPLPNFVTTKTEYTMSVQLLNAVPYVYTTTGDDFDGLEAEITFPSGLIQYIKATGEYDAKSVKLQVQYRKQGATAWKGMEMTTSGETPLSGLHVTGPQWSLGKWEKDILLSSGYTVKEGWWQYQAGTTVESDHEEGDPPEDPALADLDLWWRWIEDETVYVESGGSGTTVTGTVIIREETTQAIRKTFRCWIDEDDQGVYEICATRLQPNHVGSTVISDDTYLTTVREVYKDKFTYPRHALVGFRARATDQLSGSLRFSCMLDGAIVRVWNGSAWSFAFSNNPAWVAYDILTQPVINGKGTEASPFSVVRYDGIDPERIDVAKFLEWADYCDELVSDGFGSTEKRVTFNGGFDYETTLWEALLKVCEVGRAVPVWNGIQLTLAIDRESDPVFLFSVGNIEESSFKETYLSMEDRATEVEIDFINRDNDFERDKLTVYRTDVALNQYKASLDLFGITKASEAWRAGMYRLNCNRYLIRTVEIDVDIEALNATIGDVGYLQHDVPKWNEGGRLVSGELNTVTLDKEVTIASGNVYKILIRLSNDNITERTVTNDPGTTSVLTLEPIDYSADSAYSDYTPQEYDVYAFGRNAVLKKLYRITGIKKTQDQKCSLTLVEYREEIYAGDSASPAFGTSTQTALRAMQPRDVELEEKNVKRAGGAIEKTVLITFTPSTATDYRRVDVWYKIGGSASVKDWKRAGCTSGSAFTVHKLERGTTYTIALLPVDVYGNMLHIKRATTHVIKISGTKRAGELCCDDGTSLDVLKASTVSTTFDDDGDAIVTGGALFEYSGNEMTPSEAGEYDPKFELNDDDEIQPTL